RCSPAGENRARGWESSHHFGRVRDFRPRQKISGRDGRDGRVPAPTRAPTERGWAREAAFLHGSGRGSIHAGGISTSQRIGGSRVDLLGDPIGSPESSTLLPCVLPCTWRTATLASNPNAVGGRR